MRAKGGNDSGNGGTRPRVKTRADAPFPLKQLLILSLARIAEPIAFTSIFPYIYYMIASFNMTTNESQISVYAGMVTSSFAIAECSCSAMWGRLSDRVGRKPVLLVGLGGTGISMLTFGFARSLTVALAARFVGGLLNGNGGVLQTMVAEVVTVTEHQPRAYTFLPLTWGLGSVIGAFIGGTLADPVANYPDLFPRERNPILVAYPFLLPNLFAAIMAISGMIVGSLFFYETHPTIRYQRDRGVELGDWMVRLLTRKPARAPHQRHKTKRSDAIGSFDWSNNDDEAEGLLKDEIELVDSPSASTPSSRGSGSLMGEIEHGLGSKAVAFDSTGPAQSSIMKPVSKSVRAAFTPQVVLIILAYGILAFHTIALDQLMPVFFSLPPSNQPPKSLYLFTGGLGLTPVVMGWIFSAQAIYSMFFQLTLAPAIIRRLGCLPCFRLTAFTWVLLYFSMPYISRLPNGSAAQWTAIVLACLWKTSWGSLAYLTILILLTNSIKDGGNEAQMGVVNGVSASFASGARAIGPMVAGLLFNVGESKGEAVLVWWLTAAVALIGGLESFWMREGSGAGAVTDDDDDDEEEDGMTEQEEIAWIKGEQEGQSTARAGDVPTG